MKLARLVSITSGVEQPLDESFCGCEILLRGTIGESSSLKLNRKKEPVWRTIDSYSRLVDGQSDVTRFTSLWSSVPTIGHVFFLP